MNKVGFKSFCTVCVFVNIFYTVDSPSDFPFAMNSVSQFKNGYGSLSSVSETWWSRWWPTGHGFEPKPNSPSRNFVSVTDALTDWTIRLGELRCGFESIIIETIMSHLHSIRGAPTLPIHTQKGYGYALRYLTNDCKIVWKTEVGWRIYRFQENQVFYV